MRKVIGIGHQKGVGKDHFVNYCFDVLRTETRKLKIVRRGFADKLYQFLHSTYAWAGFREKTYYDEKPERKNEVLKNGKTPRQMLIDVGTPVMRAYDNDIWINACLKDEDYDILFVTDLRFPNEFIAIEEMGGYLIRIIRPGLPIPTDVADTALNGWEERWKFTFQNNEDKKKLYTLAEAFTLTHILERK
jgi:hypothetical protein